MTSHQETLPGRPEAADDPSLAGSPGPDLGELADSELVELMSQPAARDAACETLVARYGSMVRSCAYRYHLPAQYTEELIQVGYVGLLKAINNFDPTLSERLSGYAQACISGEIKRFFRDKRWQLRVRRADKELLLRARVLRADLGQQLGCTPADAEVASHLGVSVTALEAADMAADAFAPTSLDAQLTAADGLTLSEILGSEDPDLERTIDMAAVSAHWAELPRREQRILMMRFYGNQTQAEIAEQLGCSQMHVSRLQARALSHLRRRLLTD
jgi:RNA polymerase sigma-B factor